jgi:hypothetical protein
VSKKRQPTRPKIEIRYQIAADLTLPATVERTNLALGVMQTAAGWASILLPTGVMLANEFPSKAMAHRFNEEVARYKPDAPLKPLSPGEPTLAQFIAASGGEAAARAAVEACRKKAVVA